MPFSGLLRVLSIAEVSEFPGTECLSSLSVSPAAVNKCEAMSVLYNFSRSYGKLQLLAD